MKLLELISSETATRVCLTLAHSLWQFGLLALLAWLVARWLKRSSQQYLVHVAALLTGLLLLPATFAVIDVPSLAPEGVVVEEVVGIDEPNPGSLEAPQAVYPAKPPGEFAPAERLEIETRARFQEPPPEESKAKPGNPSADAARLRQLAKVAPWLLGVYLLGVLAMLARLLRAYWTAEKLAKCGETIGEGRLHVFLTRLSSQWKLRAAPVLKQTEQVVVPKVVGLLKPTILLPASALSGLTTDELEMILAHELAHVRRADLWVNLVQRLAETVLFFNPALWFLSRRISTLREYCCDELACGQPEENQQRQSQQLRYAGALLRVVELAGKSTHPEGLAASAANGRSPSELRRRIARLFGEKVNEPLPVGRGGLWVMLVLVALVLAGPVVWAERGEVEEKPPSDTEPVAAETTAPDYELPPLTDADRAVAAARAKSLGLKQLKQFYVSGVQEGGVVRGMEKLPAGNAKGILLKLWFAREQELGEQARYLKRIKTAWNDERLVMTSSIAFPGGPRVDRDGIGAYLSSEALAEGETQPAFNVDSKYWDGEEGWWRQSGSASPTFTGRYAKATEYFDQTSWYEIPLVWALDSRLPWPGDAIVLEHELPVELTRYQLAGTEVVDKVECDVYEGPARSEKLWIDKATGLIKAKCRYYIRGRQLPNYFTELVAEVAGRTFDSQETYREWFKEQSPELQAQIDAHFLATHWDRMKPGSLFVYSDYQEVASGVHWPLRCDRLVVQTGEGTARYYRNTTRYRVPDEMPDFSSLVAKALPEEGDKVADRRFDVPVEYEWSKNLTELQIEKWLEEKRKEKPRKVGDWKRVEAIDVPKQADAAVGLPRFKRLNETADEANSDQTTATAPITVFGRALDTEGRSIDGAKVYLAATTPDFARLGETTSDKNGNYRFDGIPLPIEKADTNDGQDRGSFEVFGTADGYALAWRPKKAFFPNRRHVGDTWGNPKHDQPPGYGREDEIELDIRFAESKSFRGRVINEQGEPIPGTRLSIRDAETDWDPEVWESAGYRPLTSLNERSIVPPSVKSRTTDAEGRFEFTALPADYRWRVSVSPPGYAGRDITVVTSSSFETDEARKVYGDDFSLMFERPKPATIQVVYGDTGKPAAKVFVNGRNNQASDWKTSDVDGRVRLSLPDGEYQLGLVPAKGTPYLRTTTEFHLTPETRADVVIAALPPAAALEIVATDAESGHPLAGVDVWIEKQREGRDPYRDVHGYRSWEVETNISHYESPRTNAEGQMQVLFEPGKHRIGVGHEAFPEGYEPVEPDGKVLDLKAAQRQKVEFRFQKKAQATSEEAKTENRLKELRESVSKTERAAQAALSDMQAKLKVMQSKPVEIAQLEGDGRRWFEASRRWADAKAEHAKAKAKLKAETPKAPVIDEREFVQGDLHELADHPLPPVPKGGVRLTVPFAGTAGDVVDVKTISVIQPGKRWLEKYGTRASEGGVPVVLDYIPPAEVPLRGVENFHEWIEESRRGDFINGSFMGQGPVAVRGAKLMRLRVESWEEATQLVRENLFKQFKDVKPGGFISVGHSPEKPVRFSYFAVLTKEGEIGVGRVVQLDYDKKDEMLIDLMKVSERSAEKPQPPYLEVRPARVLLDRDEIKTARDKNDPRLIMAPPTDTRAGWLMLADEAPIFTELDIDKAKAQKSEWGKHWDVLINLKPAAAERMRSRTTELLADGHDPNLRMAVLLDGKLLMAPTLNGVLGERVQISSGFDEQEARALVEELRPPAGGVPGGSDRKATE